MNTIDWHSINNAMKHFTKELFICFECWNQLHLLPSVPLLPSSVLALPSCNLLLSQPWQFHMTELLQKSNPELLSAGQNFNSVIKICIYWIYKGLKGMVTPAHLQTIFQLSQLKVRIVQFKGKYKWIFSLPWYLGWCQKSLYRSEKTL